jgi:type IV pilus assembly protein PilA
MNKRTKKGFTLIELIVVIAVLALLAVVAVPMVSSWVDDAKDAEAAANARTIELAMKAYMAETGATAITSYTMMATALKKYGIDDSIAKSSANYEVAEDGSVTLGTGEGGVISFVGTP